MTKDYEGDVGEAIADHAALHILYQDRPIAELELAKRNGGLDHGKDQNPEIRDAVNTLRRSGQRGVRYDSEREHSAHGTVGLTYKGKPDLELGLALLDGLAEELLPSVSALKHHRDYLLKHPQKQIKKQGKFENK